jgi:hypothetical protein
MVRQYLPISAKLYQNQDFSTFSTDFIAQIACTSCNTITASQQYLKLVFIHEQKTALFCFFLARSASYGAPISANIYQYLPKSTKIGVSPLLLKENKLVRC